MTVRDRKQTMNFETICLTFIIFKLLLFTTILEDKFMLSRMSFDDLSLFVFPLVISALEIYLTKRKLMERERGGRDR